MNWYMTAFKKYATFSGRARRKEYWYFVLFNLISLIIINFIDIMIGTFDAAAGIGLLGGLYAVLAFLPTLSVAVRRLHDTGRTGWWLLLYLIPLVGAIVIFVFLVLDSEPNENKYGNNPKI